ncbi:disintegrin and metalloproteinase domain-containing protein 10-like isoform X1 [Dermacentor albipictus]|uniref:disintegrin and metalloproteinase domain-containing protein 10-like isoform X1 n=1 Tax=Dermacentor albipictus TaxID=60249 RepID=UPI0031FC2699
MVGLGSFWIALATLSCMASIVYSARTLNDFVLHYEPLAYEPISVGSRRWKRSAAQHQAPRHVELAFRSYKREFRLRLERDPSAFSEDFTIETHRGPVLDSLEHLYSGHVVGAPDSRVVGSIIGGVFSGRISLPREGEEFYVERAGHFVQDSAPFHSLIYSARDVSFAGGRCGLHGAAKDAMDRIRRQYRRHQSQQRRLKRSVMDLDLETTPMTSAIRRKVAAYGSGIHGRNLSKTPSNRGGLLDPEGTLRKTYVQRVCNLEIAVDHTLFEAVASWQGNEHDKILRARQELTSMVSKHVKAVSEIFGGTNFNGITGIEFVVQRLVINDSSACEGPAMRTNPFCQDSLDAPHALHELSKINHDGFCASYLWTHRDFPGGTLGLAYMAEPDGFSGGICEQFQSGGGIVVDTGTTGYIGRLSLNTGVVTFLNKNMRVPQRVSEITFAHELGHNFGAPHDMPPDCVPDGTGGNFIMFASATRGNKPNNRRFSLCSVRNISAVLMQMFSQRGSRPNCLQEPQGPFCGNSIREMNEECDCGYERQDCGTDVCCYAREHGEINRKPCTLRPGAACSPSNGACCSSDCRFHNTSTACRPEDDCSFEAYCTGTSGECPPSDWKPDGTLCNHATQLCDAGECSQSVCRLYNLVDCYLTGSYLSMADMCLIACRENVPGSECKEACSFERMRDFCGRRMQPGAPCYDLQGYCDVFQKCHLIDAQGLLSRLKRLVFGGEGMDSALVRYWYLTLVAVVLAGAATAVFVRVCAVHTPSTNPHLPPERTIMSSARHPVAFIKDVTRFS